MAVNRPKVKRGTAGSPIIRAIQGNFDHLMGALRNVADAHNHLNKDVLAMEQTIEIVTQTAEDAGNDLDDHIADVTAVHDHGSLSGLGDDDHTQYAALAQNETITGEWQFNDKVVIDGSGDETQLRIQANATQNQSIFVAEASDGTNWFEIGNNNGFGKFSTAGSFAVHDADKLVMTHERGASLNWEFLQGSTVTMKFDANGRVQLPVTGSNGGLLIGGDAFLYRRAADVLTTPDSFESGTHTISGTAGSVTMDTLTAPNRLVLGAGQGFQGSFLWPVDGNGTGTIGADASAYWLNIFMAGNLAFGAGGLAADTILFRESANILATGSGDALHVKSSYVSIDVDQHYYGYNSVGSAINVAQVDSSGHVNIGDTQARTDIFSSAQVVIFETGANALSLDLSNSGAKLTFGNSLDTNLYRSAADVLKTDDSFLVGSGATVVDPIDTRDDTVQISDGTNLFGFHLDTAGDNQPWMSVSNGTVVGFVGHASTAAEGFVIGAYSNHATTIRAGGNKDFLRIATDGKVWFTPGDGYPPTLDTNLYRSAANTLKTDDSLEVVGTIEATGHIDSVEYVLSEGFMQIYTDSLVGTAGKLYFGTAADTNLYRASANVLKTDDSFHIGGGLYVAGSTSSVGAYINPTTPLFGLAVKTDPSGAYLEVQTSGGSHVWGLDLNGKMDFFTDTNLYRSAANTLSTDDSFTVGTNFDVGSGQLQVRGSDGRMTLGTDVWHISEDTKERVYFATNAVTYIKGHGGTYSVELREATDQSIIAFADDGKVWFGSGTTDFATAAPDTNLYRTSSDELKTDDNFTVAGSVGIWAHTGYYAGAGADLYLYRGAANQWRTPDSLVIDTDLTVSGDFIYAAATAADGDFLVWDDGAGIWVPTAGASGSGVAVEENNVSVDATVATLDFAHGLDVTTDGPTEVNIAVDESELDHGTIAGLSDNDHPQYILNTLVAAKGDIIGASANDTPAITTVGSNGRFLIADSAQPAGLAWDDHNAAVDPHTGYRLESADHSHASTGLQGGTLDHGTALTGLSDDDHPQYVLEATAHLSGTVALQGDISPAELTADVDDYNPAGLSGASVIRLTTDPANWGLTGLQGGADGRIIIIENIDTADEIFIYGDNTGSSAANRFRLPLGTDGVVQINPGASQAFVYDSTVSLWRMLGASSVQVGSVGDVFAEGPYSISFDGNDFTVTPSGGIASVDLDSSHTGSTHAGAAAAETADIRAANILVGTSDAAFSGEIVVGTTPNGELGGTWGAITVDATHSGSSHAGVVSTHEAAADPHTGYVLESLLDAKGDLIAASADNTPAKVTVGANDTILMADSSAGAGLKWVASATPAAVGTAAVEGTADTYTRGDHVHAHEAAHVAHDTIWAAKGDLVGGTGNDTAAVLTAGANGTILSAESGEATGLKWVVPASGGGYASSWKFG